MKSERERERSFCSHGASLLRTYDLTGGHIEQEVGAIELINVVCNKIKYLKIPK